MEVEISKKWTPLWREAHFEVKMYKTPELRITFGGWDVAKARAVVARSTFGSDNVKNTRVRTTLGQFDGGSMSKKRTPLWREAYLEVKSVKNRGIFVHR